MKFDDIKLNILKNFSEVVQLKYIKIYLTEKINNAGVKFVALR